MASPSPSQLKAKAASYHNTKRLMDKLNADLQDMVVASHPRRTYNEIAELTGLGYERIRQIIKAKKKAAQ